MKQTLTRMLLGIWRSAQRIGLSLGLITGIALLAFLVAAPLWYFSSHFPAGYTLFVLLLLAAALAAVLVLRLARLSRTPGGLRRLVNRTILPILRKTALVVASAAVAYGIVLLAGRRRIVAAVAVGLFWLLLVGFLRFGRKRRT